MKMIPAASLKILQKEFFETPKWLIDEELYRVSNASMAAIAKLQEQAIDGFLFQVNERINRKREIAGNEYPAEEILGDLRAGIFSELTARKPVLDSYRRDLQRAYIRKLAGALITRNGEISEMKLLLVRHAKKLNAVLKAAAAASSHELTREHLNGLAAHLNAALSSQPVLIVNPSSITGRPVNTNSFSDDLFPDFCR